MIKFWLEDFIALFYPRYCLLCSSVLFRQEEVLCLRCIAKLPLTEFHLQLNNPTEMVFFGRVTLYRATALCYFRQGEIVQKLIHQLKYNKRKDVGIFLGEMLGMQLKSTSDFSSVDVFIPLPLHEKKQKQRGYNQSEAICQGLAKKMPREIVTNVLLKKTSSSTQTKKQRYNRWENVSSVFMLSNPEKLIGKHVLLVDDVLTTGATLESAMRVLLQVKDIKISVACLGFVGEESWN